MKNNHWLHYWGIKSTSPFKQAVVFTTDTIGYKQFRSPATATLVLVKNLKLTAQLLTTGFANKAVMECRWQVAAGVTITQSGIKSSSCVQVNWN